MRALLIIACLGLVACEKSTPEPKPKPEQPSPAAKTQEPGTTPALRRGAREEVGITWKDPEGWKKVPPPNRMRKASYQIPAAQGDKEPAELGVFYFGASQGGSIDDNMKRWSGQFSGMSDADIKRSQRKAGGFLAHVIEIEDGTYSAGMGQGTRTSAEHYGLLGAIVETPSGLHFFKMTGPKATVKAARPAFFEMLDSLSAKKE